MIAIVLSHLDLRWFLSVDNGNKGQHLVDKNFRKRDEKGKKDNNRRKEAFKIII